MKKAFAAALALLLICLMAGCGTDPAPEEIAGKTYVYEEAGFGGDFTIDLHEDGSFRYYEGGLSSYIGDGTWTLEGDTLTLTENTDAARENHFRLEDGALVFVAEDSGNFTYIAVADGARFLPAPAETA